MAYETIDFEKNGPIGVLTLNRPKKLNAISVQLIEEANDALDKAAGAYQTIHIMGESSYRNLGLGHRYPVAVVIAYLDGALFGGTPPDLKLDEDFERVGCEAGSRVLRTFDVSGYYWLENFEQLLYAMAEDREAESAA